MAKPSETLLNLCTCGRGELLMTPTQRDRGTVALVAIIVVGFVALLMLRLIFLLPFAVIWFSVQAGTYRQIGHTRGCARRLNWYHYVKLINDRFGPLLERLMPTSIIASTVVVGDEPKPPPGHSHEPQSGPEPPPHHVPHTTKSWFNKTTRTNHMSPNLKRSITAAVVLGILLLWLSTSLVAIGTGQIGVITRFGKVTGRELSEGLNLKLPVPFEVVNRFDIKVQKEEAQATAASADLQDVNATLAINYHLERGRVKDIFQTIGTDYKARIVEPSIQESFKAVSARYTVSELITKRDDVKQATRQALADRLEGRGILIDDISITNFEFSPTFSQAVEAKQVAQQDAERANFRLEAARREAEAQAVLRTSLNQELLTKMAIEKWDGKMPTYVGSGSVFNIPLNR